MLQLAAYCLLVEEQESQAVPYGIIKYADKAFEVDYTPALRAQVVDTLAGHARGLHAADRKVWIAATTSRGAAWAAATATSAISAWRDGRHLRRGSATVLTRREASDPDPSKPRRRRAVSYVRDLHRLALGTARQAPQLPVVGIAHRIAAIPEARRHVGVAGIAQQAPQPAVLDLVGHLRAKVKIQPFVVQAPALRSVEQQPIVGGGDQVVQRPSPAAPG